MNVLLCQNQKKILIEYLGSFFNKIVDNHEDIPEDTIVLLSLDNNLITPEKLQTLNCRKYLFTNLEKVDNYDAVLGPNVINEKYKISLGHLSRQFSNGNYQKKIQIKNEFTNINIVNEILSYPENYHSKLTYKDENCEVVLLNKGANLQEHIDVIYQNKLVIAEETDELKEFGFVNYENCLLFNEDNFMEIINYVFNSEYKHLINNAIELIKSKETLEQSCNNIIDKIKSHRIAYYESMNCHLEVIGPFLEYSHRKGLLFDLYCDLNEISRTHQYFKELYGNMRYYDFNKINSNNYKIIINGANNNDLKTYTRAICHNFDTCEYKSGNITFTPLINKDYFIFPVHNLIKYQNKPKKNVVAVIGRFKDDNRETQIINKLLELGFTIYFFIRSRKWIPKDFEGNKKVKFLIKCHSIDMHNYLINEVKYILPCAKDGGIYFKDRISGSIALAYNYNIPLIMQKELFDIYNLIGYDYTTIPALDLSNEKYKEMCMNIEKHKKEIVSKNTRLLDKMFK